MRNDFAFNKILTENNNILTLMFLHEVNLNFVLLIAGKLSID